MTTTVSVSTHLRASPDQVWDLVTRPGTLVEVARPFLRFSGAAAFPPRWEPATQLMTRFWLLGLLPAPWRHHLEIRSIDPRQREIVSAERGGPVRVWNHRIAVLAEGQGTRYLDEIEIEAGTLTPLVAASAHIFYRYRQARWRRRSRAGARGAERAMGAYREPLVRALRESVGEPAAGLLENIEREARAVGTSLPATRPSDPLARNLHEAAVMLATARVLDRAGLGAVTPTVIANAGRLRLETIPRSLLRAAGRLRFTGPYQRQLADRARRSRRREYPGEWTFEHVTVRGGFGLDFRTCPILELFAADGRADLVRPICALDFAVSERMGDRLARTTTLADGGTACDFRYTLPARRWRS